VLRVTRREGQQPEVRAFNAEHGIVTQAWSPIGGITFYREGEHTSTLEDPAIAKIAESHSKSPAQVMLRWHLQKGRSVIPKSTKPRRIAENFDVFGFELSTGEVAAIDGLDTGKRGGKSTRSCCGQPGNSDAPQAVDKPRGRRRHNRWPINRRLMAGPGTRGGWMRWNALAVAASAP
jgi:hypothetical protein